ncbi:MAG: preprotein translocase subunit Sec61beta [Candidatus ainarchaeum sp.]|nr:preprotein translocase subunit Sec61beta [Candidatus ainarchaeum sp.]
MANDAIRTPSGMAGIMGFYESTGGGPALDPRGIFIFSILFIAAIKIASLLVASAPA